ncbi:MAG: hypothetical protein M3068_06255 [Gemmatimonadota bacterium]|nr:hypothetical protein [Gemmatimonadota bacterium]
MHRVSAIACAALLLGCAKADNHPADTAAPAPAPAPAKTVSLADMAGNWKVRAVPEAGDTTATLYDLTATADSSTWKMKFANGLTVPMHVSTSGDSVIVDAGPYASVRRKGVQVTTRSVMRMSGGKLTGMTTAHYKTTGPDSVLRLRTEGTRAP